MDQQPPPNQLDPDLQLEQDIHDEVVQALREMLPPPPSGSPQDWARRERVAIAKVASFVPVSASETDLAVHHVAAMVHSHDCLRQIPRCGDDAKQAAKLRAQSASMGREARGFLGKLLALQAARRKREADGPSRDSAAWSEHCVLGQMMSALERLPPPSLPPPVEAPAAAEAPAGAKAPARPRLLDYDEWPEEMKQRDRLRAKADRYAILNTMRVKLIRQLGGLPPDCDFEPPEPEVLHAIIHGDTSNLRWADSYEPWVSPAE